MTIDRSYLTDGRPYLNSRQAAEYVGYELGPREAGKTDPAIKAFYEWTYRHGVRKLPGAGLYARADLDAAVRGGPVGSERERIRAMARADLARGPRTVGRRRAVG